MKFARKNRAAAQLLSLAFLLATLLPGCETTAPQAPPPAMPLAEPRAEQPVSVASLPMPRTLPAEMKPEDTDLELGLEQAIAIGLRDNPRLREVAAQAQAARSGADIAFAPFLPELNTGFRYSGFNAPVIPGGSFVPASLNAGVYAFSLAEAGVQWTLYDFGRTAGGYGQALSRARMDELTSVRARQTVAFDVARGYFDLLFAQAFVRVHEQAVKQAEAILKDTNVRRKNGTADREAVLRAEVEVTSAQEQLVAARQRVFDGMATLNLALGRPTALPIRVRDVRAHPPFDLPLEACLEQAVGGRPEVAAAREAVAEATYGIEAARGGMLPKVYIRGTVVRVDSAQDLRGWVAGAGLHIDQPIYGGGRHVADVRRNRALAVAATAGLQSLLDRVAHQVNLAFQAIATGQERIRLGEIAVSQSRENLRLTLVKYNNGNATPTDVVDAQTALTRSEARYYTALYEYLEGLARLEYSQGGDQTRLLGALKE
jgi:outer membrane protein